MAAPNPDADPDTPDELPDATVEERWAAIVKELGELEAPGKGTGQAPDGSLSTWSEDDAPHTAGAPEAPRANGPRDWPTTPDVEALEDDESHFVAPEPEPVLAHEPLLTIAWALVVGVPVLTVVLVVVRALVPSLHVPGWLGPVGGGLFLLAVAVLLWRMPHHRDPDDHGSGAVV